MDNFGGIVHEQLEIPWNEAIKFKKDLSHNYKNVGHIKKMSSPISYYNFLHGSSSVLYLPHSPMLVLQP